MLLNGILINNWVERHISKLIVLCYAEFRDNSMIIVS